MGGAPFIAKLPPSQAYYVGGVVAGMVGSLIQTVGNGESPRSTVLTVLGGAIFGLVVSGVTYPWHGAAETKLKDAAVAAIGAAFSNFFSTTEKEIIKTWDAPLYNWMYE